MPVIMISAYVNLPEIVSAFKIGVVDYLKKPVEEEQLLRILRKALRRPHKDAADPRPELRGLGGQDFVGESEPMIEVKKALFKFGSTDAMILLEGDSGTGKGVAARILHALRCSPEQPFENLNCGALPAELRAVRGV